MVQYEEAGLRLRLLEQFKVSRIRQSASIFCADRIRLAVCSDRDRVFLE
jgi:hypothetical protein